jgi:hypothetical protein
VIIEFAQFIAVCSAYILAEERGISSRLQRPSRDKTWTSSRPPLTHGHALRRPTNSDKLSVPNYGERYRHGEAIATGFVESTVNQVVSKRFCKKQQMQWSKRGAHLLLQTRVKDPEPRIGHRVQALVSRHGSRGATGCGLIPRFSMLSKTSDLVYVDRGNATSRTQVRHLSRKLKNVAK